MLAHVGSAFARTPLNQQRSQMSHHAAIEMVRPNGVRRDRCQHVQ